MRQSIRLMLLIVLLAGCGKSAVPKTKSVVSMDEVPTVVMAAARKKEPDVTFNKVIKAPEGFYEVQGKNKSGKIVEVEVNEKGEVLKVE
jgi:hypothetical protein